jgi:hypothetical protein
VGGAGRTGHRRGGGTGVMDDARPIPAAPDGGQSGGAGVGVEHGLALPHSRVTALLRHPGRLCRARVSPNTRVGVTSVRGRHGLFTEPCGQRHHDGDKASANIKGKQVSTDPSTPLLVRKTCLTSGVCVYGQLRGHSRTAPRAAGRSAAVGAGRALAAGPLFSLTGLREELDNRQPAVPCAMMVVRTHCRGLCPRSDAGKLQS